MAALLRCMLAYLLICRPLVFAGGGNHDEERQRKRDLFTKSTFMSKLLSYSTSSHEDSQFHRNLEDLKIFLEERAKRDAGEGTSSGCTSGDCSETEKKNREEEMQNMFIKLTGRKYDPEYFDRKLQELLKKPDPLYGTNYSREWGRACLTHDGEIPNTEYLIHFDIYQILIPPGLDFEDLRCLHLYNVQKGYSLYKIRMGDMVITLRPDLEQVSLHLFEDFWGHIIARVLYVHDGILNRHEYTEISRGSQTFHKTKGPATHYVAQTDHIGDLNAWLDEKYKVLSKRRPPIIEEVMYFPEEDNDK